MKTKAAVSCIAGALAIAFTASVYAGGLPGQEMPKFDRKGGGSQTQMTGEMRDLQSQIDQLRKELEALRKDVYEYRKIHWNNK